jgi:DNA-binding NarL/FixJ family response regulator
MGSRVTFDAATKSGRPSSALVPAKSLARPSTPAAVAAKLAGQRQSAPSGQTIHIALVDDDPSIHAAMRQTFKVLASDWTLDSYLDGNLAIDRIKQVPPRAVLMDITMPEMTGIECTKKIKALLPDLPVVMFSARTDTDSFISSMIAGASGYVVKPSSPSDTISAVKKALEGFPALCAHSEKTIVQWLHTLGENVFSWGLTAREQQVMLQVCSNRCDKDIACLLKISPATVHIHLHNIYKKLGVGNRSEARRKFLNLNF